MRQGLLLVCEGAQEGRKEDVVHSRAPGEMHVHWPISQCLFPGPEEGESTLSLSLSSFLPSALETHLILVTWGPRDCGAPGVSFDGEGKGLISCL